jgi:hypothetical protein
VTIAARRYDPAEWRRWDAFVEASNNGHFMHRRGYMDYHADRFDDCSLLFERGNSLVAVLPAHRRGDDLVSHDGLPFAGLLTRQRTHLAAVEKVASALLAFMASQGLRRLVYRPVPFPYHRAPAEEDQWALERLGARVIDVKVGSLLPRRDAPPLRKERRRYARRAQRSGVRIGRSKDFGAFMELLADFLHWRHGATPVHTREEMELLASRFPEEICLYTAEREGELLGGRILYRAKRCSRLQYIATSREGMALGVGDALYAHLLELDVGPWLDLGLSMDPTSGEVNGTLLAYKESIGARAMLRRTWELSLAGERPPR